MLAAYSRFLTRHALPVVLVVIALTALAVTRILDVRTLAPRLLLDPSIESLIPKGDANRAFYDETRRIFGNDETLLLVLHREEGAFHAPLLAALTRITERAERADGVVRAVSIANAANIRAAGDDLEIAPLFDTPPSDPAELARVRHAALANPVFQGTLVSADARSVGIAIQLADMTEAEFEARDIDREIQRLAREELGELPEAQAWLVGSAHLKAETSRFLLRDLSLVIPLAFGLITLIAFLSFRSLRGVLLAVSTIGIAELWTFGVMAEVNPSLNLVTVSVPSLLLVIGFAYAVHVIACYYDAVEEGAASPSLESAATRGLSHVILPTLLTSLTTSAGFFSLTTNSLSAIRDFGFYGGIGVAFAALAALTWTPAVLELLPEPRPRGRRHETNAFDRLLGRLGAFDYDHARAIIAVAVLLALLSCAGIPRIVINSTMVSNFGPDTGVRRDVEAVNRNLGGAGQLQIVLAIDQPDAFKEPANLALIEELQIWLREVPQVTGSTSIADYVKLLHRAFNRDEAAEYRIPDSKRLTAQLLFLGSSDDAAAFADSRYQIANVRVRTTALDSGDLGALVGRIEERLAALPAHVEGHVTGSLVLLAKTNDAVAYGQALSVSSAFVSIFAIMALLFMSFRIGMIAMIPNVLPVLFYFGILGWSGITLNVTTGLVASIVLGIAVDDTIHYLSHFNVEARRAASEREGVRAALMQVGRPVTYTTLALCLGFLALSLSSLRQQAEFGVLASITLLFGWLADMTFTPAIASRIRIVTLWDALTLDLGENPERAIPLFRGMSRAQARIVALMTRIEELKAGARLIEMGRKEDGMYVVIDGRLTSSVPIGGSSVPLNTHGRGDVVGEVGLLRGERTANVDCETDARLLRLDRDSLARLRRRYPRIAAHLYRNLSDLLAGRLAAITPRVH